MSAAPPTGTVTFLFTDIQGSTELWERDRQAMAVALERHDAILRGAAEEAGGYVFHEGGDGFGIAFGDALEGVQAAIGAQQALHAERFQLGDAGPLLVRMGLHTGLVELKDGNYFGRPVNRAARIRDAAAGGQVYVSLATQQLLRDAMPQGARLLGQGTHRLKGLENDERIYLLAAPGMPEIDSPPASLEQLAPGKEPRTQADPDAACPYRGLHAFREEDARFFFGREVFTELLLESLSAAPMLGVVGPSGSGKSSVVHAGLIPRLREGAAEQAGSQPWTVTCLRPGNRPFHALAASLVPLLEPEASQTDLLVETGKMADALEAGQVGLHDVMGRLRELQPELGRLLLVADQFEELYTLCPEESVQRRFQDVLFEAAFGGNGSGPALWLTLTLRADFMGHALAYRPFADAMQKHDVKLGPMNGAEIRRVIEKPAELQGRAFEAGLVDRIAKDVGEKAGALPLLEFALTKLWDRQEAGWLTHEAYEEIGRVEGAVSRHADEVYKKLDEAEQQRARRVFVQLVQPGEGTEDTRRLASRSELEADWSLVQSLADERLVTTGRDADGHETAEVIHEALIRSWGRLVGWMKEDRRFRAWQERLRFAIQQWQAAGRDEGALLRGVPLAEAEEWLLEREGEVTQAEQDFIEAGVTLRQRREDELAEQERRERALEARGRRLLRVIASVSIGAAIVASALALLAWNATRDALEQSDRAHREALASKARSLRADGDNETALALALEAASGDEVSVEVESTLVEAALSPGARRIFGPHPEQVAGMAVGPDGRTLYVAPAPIYDGMPTGEDLAIRAWDIDSAEEIRRFEDIGEKVFGLAVSPDGSLVVGVTNETRRGHLWDASTGELLRSWPTWSGSYTVDFLPDGKHVLAAGSVFDVTTGERTLELLQPGPMYWAVDVNDKWAALSEGARAHVFDLDTGKSVLSLEKSADVFITLVPDSTSAIVGWDGHLEKHDFATGQVTDMDVPVGMAPWSIAVSPDGTLCAVGGWSGDVYLINVGTGSIESSLRGHRDQVSKVEFGPEGERLYSGSLDKTVREWDVRRGAALMRIRDPRLGGEVAFTADGSGVVAYVPASTSASTTSLFVSLTGTNDASSAARVDVQSAAAPPTSTIPWMDFSLDSEPRSASRRIALSKGGDLIAVTDHSDRELDVYDLRAPSHLWGEESPHAEAAIWALSFHPDGAELVTGGWDNWVRVWDAKTGDALREFELEEPIDSITHHPGGKLAAAGLAYSNDLVLVDLASGAVKQRYVGHAAKPDVPPAFSPNGRLLLTGAVDRDGRLWDVESGELLVTLEGHTARLSHVAFGPDGNLVLTSSADNTVRIWDLEGKELQKLPGGHEAFFRSDGLSVFARSSDASAIYEWPLSLDLESVRSWALRNRHVPALGCSERLRLGIETECDESTADDVAASGDSEPDAAPLPRMVEAPIPRAETSRAESASSTEVAAGEPQQAVAGARTGRLAAGGADAWRMSVPEGHGLWATMSAIPGPVGDDGSGANGTREGALDPRLVLRDENGAVIARAEDRNGLFDTDAELRISGLESGGDYTLEARSFQDESTGAYTLEVRTLLPETRTIGGGKDTVRTVLLTQDARQAIAGDYAGTVRGVDLNTGITRWETNEAQEWVHSLALHPSQPIAVAGRLDGSIEWIDVRDGSRIDYVEGHTDTVRGLAFTREGTLLSASTDESIAAWEAGSSTPLFRLTDDVGEVAAMDVTADGGTLVFGTVDGEVSARRLPGGEVIWARRPFSETIWALSITPDGRSVVFGGGAFNDATHTDIHVWQLDDGQEIAVLRGHDGAVMGVDASSGGGYVFSAGRDGVIRQWDLESGTVVGHWAGHHGGSDAVAVDAAEGVFVSGGRDTMVRVWELGDRDPADSFSR